MVRPNLTPEQVLCRLRSHLHMIGFALRFRLGRVIHEERDRQRYVRLVQVARGRLRQYRLSVDGDDSVVLADRLSHLCNRALTGEEWRIPDAVRFVERLYLEIAEQRLGDTSARADWGEVQSRLDEMRLEGQRWTSHGKMAESFGCAKSTVFKAIEKGSVELQEWATKPRGPSRSNASPEVSSVALKTGEQHREPDPAAVLEDADKDVAMGYLLEQAGPHERAHILAMPPDAQRQLAETAYRDPDLEEQIERYRESRLRQHSR